MPGVALRGTSFWTPAGLAQTLGARWLREPADPQRPVAGLGIDSRTIEPGEAFLAIVGERFDGHDYVVAAAERGAALAIVERDTLDPAPPADLPVLRVPDTVTALQQLARAWRQVLREQGCQVIAVAGSNGKTTTRHLIHTVLDGARRGPAKRGASPAAKSGIRSSTSDMLAGTQSPRSFNNHLGVPLTLLAARAEHDFVVVEIGSNHPGEVAALAELARPDAAVVTSIGREHLEFFGSLDAIAREEGAVLTSLPPDGFAVVEAQAWERIAPHITLPEGVQLVRYGTADDADLRLTDPQLTAAGSTRFNVDGTPFELPLLGEHNAINALAAIALARRFGIDEAQIRAQLAKVQPVEGRLQWLTMGPVHVIHDAYNANPDSMRAALDVLTALPVSSTRNSDRRIAILGDMLELGSAGPDEHRSLGRDIAERDAIDLVILVGSLAMFIAEALQHRWPTERVRLFAEWRDEVPTQVADLLAPGDVVLLKASRGLRLERLLPAIRQRFDTPATTIDPVPQPERPSPGNA